MEGISLETKGVASTESLIPPIYYTTGIKDPLYQTDLVEKIR